MTKDDDAKMRVMAEYEQLNARISALTAALDNGIGDELDDESLSLLKEQWRVMRQYRNILQRRLLNWKPKDCFGERKPNNIAKMLQEKVTDGI